MADQSWSLIDSDPIVFSTMIRELGVRDVDVEELYSLDDDGWQQLRHCVDDVYGFIFLVKIPTAAPEDPRPVLDLPNVFFAKQVVNNACASQALLSVLLNAEHVDLGPTLSDFKAFAIACDPETRGLCIGNSDEIRQVHNSFASKTGVAFEGEAPDDEAFHFVAYVPAAGGVVELDGLSRGPILCGKTDGGSWASLAMTAVREKIELVRTALSNPEECRFTLLMVARDEWSLCQKKVEKLLKDLELAKLLQSGADLEAEPVWSGSDPMQRAVVMSYPNLEEFNAQVAAELASTREQLTALEAERAAQARSIARKRHDWMPFSTEMLK